MEEVFLKFDGMNIIHGKNQSNICVVNFPMSKTGSKAAIIPILHLLKILSSFSKNIYIITGHFSANLLSNKCVGIQIIGINHEKGSKVFIRIVNYMFAQLKISFRLMEVSRNVDIYIFFMMGQDLILPMLMAKLLKKKVVLALAVSSVRSDEAKNDIFSKPLNLLSKINCRLSNGIIIYSENLIKEWNLEKYRNKIYIGYEHFLDFDKFKIKKKIDKRKRLVGYIGRLSEEKGILNFVKAIPMILKENDDLDFLIGGDGELRNRIVEDLNENHLRSKVKITGWISHDELPDYLNELKLVVLPSYTEGLPNLMLESIACGTPVLATPVGAIPDLIKDGETGFIMENNSPECIAENVKRVLNHSDLEGIMEYGRKLIEEKFVYERAIENWRMILFKCYESKNFD